MNYSTKKKKNFSYIMNNVLRTFFFKTKKEDPLTMVTIAQNQYALKYGSRSRTSRIDKRMQFA